MCFAVPDNEAQLVAEALSKRFERAIEAGRISKVGNFLFSLNSIILSYFEVLLT